MTAQHQQLTSVMNWLEYSGSQLELDSQLLLRLQLVTEELFLNTLQHGYGQACDAPIELSLTEEAGQVRLTYSDRAPAFDPRSQPARQNPEQAGAGLALICQLPDELDYQRRDGCNLICLRFGTPSRIQD
ncbi:MAG: ATP-binding protein [Azovibrio sp.]|uniref:ATP-binding protein n=1 Tax=Azovibrio sp. TaxID=1872673 RepID=UPI003C771E37